MSKLYNPNLYACNTLKNRVKEYGDSRLWGYIIRQQFSKKIAELQKSIDTHHRLITNPDPTDTMTTMDHINDIQTLQKSIDELKDALKKALKKDSTFAETNGDKALYRSYVKAMKESKTADQKTMLTDALILWFAPYQTDDIKFDQNCKFIHELVNDMMSYTVAVSASRLVRQLTKGEKLTFTTDIRTKGGFLNLFYSILTQKFVNKIPNFLREVPADVLESIATRKNSK